MREGLPFSHPDFHSRGPTHRWRQGTYNGTRFTPCKGGRPFGQQDHAPALPVRTVEQPESLEKVRGGGAGPDTGRAGRGRPYAAAGSLPSGHQHTDSACEYISPVQHEHDALLYSPRVPNADTPGTQHPGHASGNATAVGNGHRARAVRASPPRLGHSGGGGSFRGRRLSRWVSDPDNARHTCARRIGHGAAADGWVPRAHEPGPSGAGRFCRSPEPDADGTKARRFQRAGAPGPGAAAPDARRADARTADAVQTSSGIWWPRFRTAPGVPGELPSSAA